MVLVVKNPLANVGDVRDPASDSELGRSPAEGQGNPLQYSCLENPADRGAWWAPMHVVAQSQTQLKQLSTKGRALDLTRAEGDLIHCILFYDS